MWLLYVGTGDGLYKEAAENAENLLDGAFAEYDHLHHDVGFMWHISAGVNYRLTGIKIKASCTVCRRFPCCTL